MARNRVLEVLAISVACLLVFFPTFRHGVSIGHSAPENLSWASAFIFELSTGEIYPRWLSTLWNGTGAADFYFYAPLPFFVTAGIYAVCGVCDVPQSFAGAAFLFHIISGVGMLGLMRALRVPGPALVAALVFLLLPYHFNNWSVRQAVGEFAATAFVPYFLWGLVEASRGQGYLKVTVATGLIGISHLPSLLIVGVISIALSMFALRPESAKLFLMAVLAVLSGIALAAVYWVPAISLLDIVESGYLTARDWRASTISAWVVEWGVPNTEIFLPFVLMSLLTAFTLATTSRPLTQYARVQITILLVAWLFVLPISPLVWENTPIKFLQFPWRFLMATDIVFAITFSVLWARTIGTIELRAVQRQWIAAFSAGAGAFFVVYFVWVSVSSPRLQDWPEWMFDIRIGAIEWLGRSDASHGLSWEEMIVNGPPAILKDQRQVWSQSPGGKIEMLSAEPRLLRFKATCPQACKVVLRRGYWKYWRLEAEDGGPNIPLRSTPDFPLIFADLPATEATYRLRLEQPLSARIGLGITLATMFGIIGLMVFRRRRI